jgi:hypothetical protein
MFQLIVAVISIALVAALAIASIYYGGEAFQKSSLKANVTTLVNGGQQIAGGQALYKTDHSGISATDLDDLILDADGNQYLTAAPGVSGAAAGDWSLNTDGSVAVVAVNTAGTLEICNEAAKQAGEAEYAADQAALTALPATATEPTGQFGCFKTATGVNFGFKL